MCTISPVSTKHSRKHVFNNTGLDLFGRRVNSTAVRKIAVLPPPPPISPRGFQFWNGTDKKVPSTPNSDRLLARMPPVLPPPPFPPPSPTKLLLPSSPLLSTEATPSQTASALQSTRWKQCSSAQPTNTRQNVRMAGGIRTQPRVPSVRVVIRRGQLRSQKIERGCLPSPLLSFSVKTIFSPRQPMHLRVTGIAVDYQKVITGFGPASTEREEGTCDFPATRINKSVQSYSIIPRHVLRSACTPLCFK